MLRTSPPSLRLTLAAALISVVTASPAPAAPVAWWRMDADSDPATAGAQVADQFPGGSILSGATASISTSPTPGPIIPDPITPAILPNDGALDGNADVNAQAASYEALNVGSITVEGFFRTREATATLVGRSNGTSSTAGTKGFVISRPDNVTVTYYVNGVAQTLVGATAINLDDPFTHIAFTYDAATGLANLYADGILRGTNTTAGGGALFAPGDAIPVVVGGTTFSGVPNTGGYDGGGLSATGGLIDEIRISDAALTPLQFLRPVPEPAAATLSAIALAAIAARRTRRPLFPRT
jgi:hypothetical protein